MGRGRLARWPAIGAELSVELIEERDAVAFLLPVGIMRLVAGAPESVE